MKRQAVILLAWMFVWGAVAAPVRAQDPSLEAQTDVVYAFGEQITFEVVFPPDVLIERVELLFQANSEATIVEEAEWLEGRWVVVHDVKAQPVRAFSTVFYKYRVTLEDGESQDTEWYSFLYEDNRFEWKTLEGVPFRVHWVEGDTAFAQSVLDTARAGAQQSGAILDAEFPETVNVYIYARLDDYQFARDAMGPAWAGGHADPKGRAIVVTLPPGENQRLEIERKIPHEVAHMMLYQATGEGFWNLPTWLNEGFASIMEMNPNPDYPFLVTSAVQNGTLIPLSALCQPFPWDASGAVLAYAESTSFVRYIQQRYGQQGLRAIIENYADGASCELGTMIDPVGLRLSQLEREWREGPLAENLTLNALRKVAPWVVLFAAMLTGPVIVVMGSMRSRPLEGSV